MPLNAASVIVIGGTSGIGLAVAEQAAARGAHVTVASSNQDRVDEAIKTLPHGTRGARLDVTDEAAVRDFFQHTGRFDHLVYTAGEPLLLKPVTELTTAEARLFFQTRYWGAFTAVKQAVPLLRDSGSIVLSSGTVVSRPAKGTAAAASVTGATEALVRALAVELAPLRVNAVRPGPVRTALWHGTVPDPEALYNDFSQQLLLHRIGEPGEAAAAYIYLMSNGFTTGTVITADGGQSLV
jgi:NAD(P)-dependent dehydrogenase (short-subunit alcohol dehydrogenase family)